MDVLGHEDVAEDVELVGGAEFLEFFEEGDSGEVVVEKGKSTVTTEGDEVIVAERLVSLQVGRHGLSGFYGFGLGLSVVREWYGRDSRPHPFSCLSCRWFETSTTDILVPTRPLRVRMGHPKVCGDSRTLRVGHPPSPVLFLN